MARLLVWSFFFSVVSAAKNNQDTLRQIRQAAPELFMGTVELARQNGYTVDTHFVQTADGYVLGLHRLRGRPGGVGAGSPVLLQHGLFGASDMWLLAGPGSALGYLLADQGYDVWMGNVRGNKYSRRHVRMSPKEPAFWNFSFHEIGLYDMPAAVDYITSLTRHPRLYYVGHSMGNTVFYVMTSMRPEYNSKIRLAVGLSPVAYMGRVRAPGPNLLLPFTPRLMSIAKRRGTYEIFPYNPSLAAASYLLCRDGTPSQRLCVAAYELAYGRSDRGFNASRLPFYLSHVLSGASAKTMVHFLQNIAADSFRWWDEGPQRNMLLYKQQVPPPYDLRKVTTPTLLCYSDGDYVLDPKGVQRLSRVLPNVSEMYRVPTKLFSHIDFLVDVQVKPLLYDKVLDTLARF